MFSSHLPVPSRKPFALIYHVYLDSFFIHIKDTYSPLAILSNKQSTCHSLFHAEYLRLGNLHNEGGYSLTVLENAKAKLQVPAWVRALSPHTHMA